MAGVKPAPSVRDDAEHHRFVVEQDGAVAFLDYRREPGRLILIHTETPAQLEGHGVGTALVRHALDVARAERLTVVPWCPFARGWMRRHMDQLGDLDVDWKTPPPH